MDPKWIQRLGDEKLSVLFLLPDLVTEEAIASIFLQNIWDEAPNHNKKDFAS